MSISSECAGWIVEFATHPVHRKLGTPDLPKFMMRVSTKHPGEETGFAPFEFPGAHS